ncbi:hypothetical protein [Pseudoalteromonas ostreae]|uniref:hypothetical protein n=1 Tax=Pseudoalteromonas ostreae TaxID=2774154 RepID=UPI001B362843|nr:hypothetical protein [Pseudoalteromonas ostreae]
MQQLFQTADMTVIYTAEKGGRYRRSSTAIGEMGVLAINDNGQSSYYLVLSALILLFTL